MFSFPIRLQLSRWSGYLLRLAGFSVRTEGNVILKDGVEMAVDPACMGLQLTGVSLLLGLFFLIWQERQTQKSISFGWVISYAVFVFGLAIFCNMFRIMALVAFGSLPGTASHEGIGLVCVAVYAWLPAWLMAHWLLNRFGHPLSEQQPTMPKQRFNWGWQPIWGTAVLMFGVGILFMASRSKDPAVNRCQRLQTLPIGWQKYGADCLCKTLSNGIVQLSKPGVLIYLKPQPDWFSADHSPMACWRGSGYELRRVRETTLDGHPAYVGELSRKGKRLYSAWWFSNGKTSTVSQLALRKQMLLNEGGFFLVNVTLAKPTASFGTDALNPFGN
ncbi:hypothetical protein GCM10028818_35230 [Spirosoma horti]